MELELAAKLIKEHRFCSDKLKEKLSEFLYNLEIDKDFFIFPEEETFNPISGYDGYLTSSLGKIYSLKSNRYLKPFISNSGYEVISLSNNGRTKKFSVHRVICLSFRENPNNLDIVDHIDSNKLNNHVNNVRWSTNSFNQFNRYKGALWYI